MELKTSHTAPPEPVTRAPHCRTRFEQPRNLLDRVVQIITSLRLTVALLALGLVLVFWGTLAQVKLGLYSAQNEFFRSFFIYQAPPGIPFRVPFPGGYLIGWLLLINLMGAHLRYYQPGKKKYGIVLIHTGVVLLLIGQLLTDVLSSESQMHLRTGETRNYSEAPRDYELAVVDTTDPETDKVVTIPIRQLERAPDIADPALPFALRIVTFHANSSITETATVGYAEVKTTAGFGAGLWWRGLPLETELEKRDIPSAIIELTTPQESLGTYLVSALINRPQTIPFNGRLYQLSIRNMRFYKPFSIQLVEFKHDRYPGTDIPKNFSSRVRLKRAETAEDREVLIFMNNPLRYGGETYYQASFDVDDQGTVLQVVHNPSWLTPYFACVLVGAGLLFQFLSHLVGFASKRRASGRI